MRKLGWMLFWAGPGLLVLHFLLAVSGIGFLFPKTPGALTEFSFYLMDELGFSPGKARSLDITNSNSPIVGAGLSLAGIVLLAIGKSRGKAKSRSSDQN